MWTIDELVTRVAAALSGGYPGAPNGRVRDVPDRRAVRWYATTGLIDRPAAMRGRTALYGRRHLLQLVAVKRRQAEGRTLAQIQAELTGATDHALARIARVPDELLSGADQTAGERTAGPATVRPRFWAHTPATPEVAAEVAAAAGPPEPAGTPQPPAAPQQPPPPKPSPLTRVAQLPAAPEQPTAPDASPLTDGPQPPAAPEQSTAPEPSPLTGVALGGGVVLLLPGRPAAGDQAAIAAAARPLLDLLAARGLTAGRPQGAAGPAPAGQLEDDPTDRRAARTRRSSP